MKIGIMQPYFLPYIGYFQLINHVDKFVVYDNIKYTKKGWINRNRMLVNGTDQIFSLPIKKDSDYLNICDRFIPEEFHKDADKILRKIQSAYREAPFFEDVYPLMEKIFTYSERNLFNYIFNALSEITGFLGIETVLEISSEISIDHTLKSDRKVLAICKSLGGTVYVNPAGGKELYEKKDFGENQIELTFLTAKLERYDQFDNAFVPGLSILDVLMFNSKSKIMSEMINNFNIS